MKGRAAAGRGTWWGPRCAGPTSPVAPLVSSEPGARPYSCRTARTCIHLPRGRRCLLLRGVPCAPLLRLLPGWSQQGRGCVSVYVLPRLEFRLRGLPSSHPRTSQRRGPPSRPLCSLPLAGRVLLSPQNFHTAPHSPDTPATAPTFGGAPGLASEGRSESSVSSRAQASSWERCMVPAGWRGAHRRGRGQASRRARSWLAGLRCGRGSQSCAAPAGCALSPRLRSLLYNPTCR